MTKMQIITSSKIRTIEISLAKRKLTKSDARKLVKSFLAFAILH